jgi:hypothetical protein
MRRHRRLKHAAIVLLALPSRAALAEDGATEIVVTGTRTPELAAGHRAHRIRHARRSRTTRRDERGRGPAG